MRPIDADDLIDRFDLLEKSSFALRGMGLKPIMAIEDIKTVIQAAPTMNTEAVRKEQSEWLEDSDPGQEYGSTWACRECGHSMHCQTVWNPIKVKWKYCPWCGRRTPR